MLARWPKNVRRHDEGQSPWQNAGLIHDPREQKVLAAGDPIPVQPRLEHPVHWKGADECRWHPPPRAECSEELALQPAACGRQKS